MDIKLIKVEHKYRPHVAQVICQPGWPWIWMLWDFYETRGDAEDMVAHALKESPDTWDFRIDGEPYGRL